MVTSGYLVAFTRVPARLLAGGQKASKAQLRRLILAMVKQVEIETAGFHRRSGDALDAAPGDVPCLFGTLTSQRYHWDQVIRIIAEVESICTDW